ncbi:MAG TPA: hypothetical protein VLB69_04190 [Rudaea sp.]|nr:hypothetical protein [Rudaea sp.]
MARHLRKLLEEDKRRAAQPPAWQRIAHHDRPVPAEAHPYRQSDRSGPSLIRRDRGGN